MDQIQKITWTSDFKIGIDDVDLQHESFVFLINRLIDELGVSDDPTYKHRLLEELCLYAGFHFTSEENLMMKTGFPGLKEHKHLHRHLLSSLNDRINYYKLSRETEKEIIIFLIDWFTRHTLEKDRLFGQFMRENLTPKR